MTLLRKFLAATLAGLMFLAGAVGAVAQTIPVRSGEHEDFSRLVLLFPEEVQWQFGKFEGGYEFRSDQPQATFALGNVFALIPRDRIKSVRDLGAGRLFLAVDCDCYADAFDLRGGKIVLDIKDGAPLASAQVFNQPLHDLSAETPGRSAQAPTPGGSEPGNPAAASVLGMEIAPFPTSDPALAETDTRTPLQVRRGLPLLVTQNGPIVQASPEPLPNSNGYLPPPGQERPATPPDHVGPANAETPVDPARAPRPEAAQAIDERVVQTQRQLLEQIGRAAAQGLLEADTTRTEALIEQSRPSNTMAAEAEAPVPTAPTPPPERAPEPEDHVIIQTVIDRQFSNRDQREAVTEDGLMCPQDTYFDVATWGEDPSGGIDLGPYRDGLVGEFDTPQPEAVSALVKYYIFLTFGAEATALLNAYEPEIDRADILHILAQIMDRKSSDMGPVLAPYIACGGKVAMWAALAVEHIDPLQEINAPAIAAAFSELPIHLRKYLAPPLVTRLLEVGETDLATMIRNSVDRAEREPDPSALFVRAQLEMGEGSPSEAISALEQVAFGNSEHAPEALLELIAFKLEQGMEVTEKEISTAASFAFEQRGTDIGRALQVAEITALAETARFSEAFERFALAESRGDLSPEDGNPLLSEMLRNLALKASDAQFLRFAVNTAGRAPLSAEARLAVASRFDALGFYQDARSVLSQSAKLPDTRERLLFASIAIAEKKYNVAIGYLAGLEDPDALRLRGRALAGRREMPAAIQAYTQAGDDQIALQLAWRDGDWQQVSLLDNDILGAASRLKMTEPAPPPDQIPRASVLSADAQLLARSEQTREVIAQLMRRFPMR